MKKAFEKFGILLDENKIKKFDLYREFLKENNEKFNITAILDDDGINEKHFLDSAVACKYFKENKSVIEIGSGGGFPSLPIKIVLPSLKFTLLESNGKKCNFLRQTVEKLKLCDVKIIEGRAEEYGKKVDFREKFDYATARAVAPLNILLEYITPFLKVGGKFIALKGRADEEIKLSENAIKTLNLKINKVDKFILSELSGERTIIEIEKIGKTPDIYPRLNGQIIKKPL